MEAGQLDFDAPIGTYLPDYPNRDAARTITIHHLLTHQAGLPPYLSARYMRERDRVDTLDQQTRIYDSAGMSKTGFEPSSAREAAKGYFAVGPDGRPAMSRGPIAVLTRRDDLRENTALLDRGNPAGGGYSTAEDLLAFAQALKTGKLLGHAMTSHILKGTFSGKQRPKYGYALREQVVGGRRFVGNGGGAPGINTEFRFEPDGDFSMIVLSNLSPPSATTVLEHVLETVGGLAS